MSKNVSMSKGIGIDGIHEELFNIKRHKQCKRIKGIKNLCDRCKKKLMWIKIFTTEEYWKT